MRRLSVIDIVGGQQPIHNEDRSVWIIFNGEIYNFPDLRRDLKDRGHQFYTKSDTEVIVHLYEELGSACVTKLRGMFAFAIYDERRRSVLLARDRLGCLCPYTYISGPMSRVITERGIRPLIF
jgi:asparagine synthase (glutamine-hydrolysing)